jgi:hypothetical protein
MKLIPSTTMAQAWLEACQYLLGKPGWVDTTLVLHVDAPMRVRRQDRAVANALDAFLLEHEQFNNHTVAETIFPGYEYKRRGVDGVYNVYPDEIYPRIKDHPEMRRWGAYAYRLVRRRNEDGTEYNPLEYCIRKMKDKQPKRAAYELGLGFGFDLALYDDDDDRTARFGGPCLSHLSFKLIGGKVHLTAMYRSHYYLQRAYGNLLGLARLMAFVADQADVAPGPLVCHSTMARLEYGKEWGWLKGEVPPLIASCEKLMRAEAAEQIATS